MARLKPIALLVLLAALYSEPLATLAGRWWVDSDYSHGFLVAGICLFLGIRAWRNTRADEGTLAGMVLLVPGVVLYLLGRAAAEIFSIRLSLLPVLAGITLVLAGRDKGKALLFPIAFFVFAIPLPEVLYFTLTSPLQTLAARMGTAMTTSVGVFAARHGNIVQVGDVSLGVGEACSGLRSLMAYSAVSVLLARYLHKAWSSRILVVSSAVAVAMFANALRLFLTSVGTVVYGPGFAEGQTHTLLGVVVFITGVLVLLTISEVLRWAKRRRSTLY